MSTEEEREAPLAEIGGRRLRRLARRASRRRRRGRGGLADLARATGIDVRRLRWLADAWDEGGMAGVDALGEPADEPEASAAAEVVEDWRRRHFPLDSLRYEVAGNQVTVWRLLPPRDRTGPPEPVPLLQLRVTTGDRWHLYRRAAQGEWWPVIVHGADRGPSLRDCLDAARVDAGNRFWRSEPYVDEDAGELD